MTRLRAHVWLGALALLIAAPSAQAQDFPRFEAPVVDAADVVPDDAEDRLNRELIDYQERSGNQIAVAVVETIGEASIEDYSEDLFDEWGVGREDLDNGVLVVIAMSERRMRIEVGFGVEGDLTDLESGRIVREQMEPRMRGGDVGGALEAATAEIRLALGDTQAQAPAAPAEDSQPSAFPFIAGAVGFMFLFQMMRRMRRGGRRGRRRGDFSLWPILIGTGWGTRSGGLGGGGFGGGGVGGGGFGGGGGGGSGGGGASGGW